MIVVLFAVDILSRFLPLDPLCFQAWECLTRYQEPGAIFQANREFRSDHTHGNLSNMGNLPNLRQYRAQVFTTDEFGFRNIRTGAGAPDAVVVGDSFVAGYGLSNEETLPARLSAITGRDIYNAGGPYAYLETVRSLKARLRLRTGRAIVVWTESVPISLLKNAEASSSIPDQRGALLLSTFGQDGARVRAFLRGWWYTSPVKILAEKAYLRLSDDRILPNTYRHRVVQRRLVNGDVMLFYPPDVEDLHRSRDVGGAAEYLAWLASELRREGFDPVVVLAPNKYTVYYPLLEDPKPPPADVVHPYARLETTLERQGVPVLNLTDLFREKAREALRDREYLYWLDDTHWNGRGTSVAAGMIHRTWFEGAATN